LDRCRRCGQSVTATTTGAARRGSKRWFMDIKNWETTAQGNPSIVVKAKGVERRVVLFRYKQAPTRWGFLLINTRTDETTFSERRYPTEIAAHEGMGKSMRDLARGLTLNRMIAEIIFLDPADMNPTIAELIAHDFDFEFLDDWIDDDGAGGLDSGQRHHRA
jgi:hypothetical protein